MELNTKYELPVNYNKLKPSEKSAVRNQYVLEQRGLCAYCGEPLSDETPLRIRNRRINWALFPPKFLEYPIHLQHNHKTGMTEGAVHNYCNAVMWQYENR
jgi:hypothetical protein